MEIKARITESLESLLPRVASIAYCEPSEIFQDDTFVTCPNGRLKLRTLSETEGELIFYQRSDGMEPKEYQYVIAETALPDSLREVLKLAYVDAGRVRKARMFFGVVRTRVHVDLVVGLGNLLNLKWYWRRVSQSSLAWLLLMSCLKNWDYLPNNWLLKHTYIF